MHQAATLVFKKSMFQSACDCIRKSSSTPKDRPHAPTNTIVKPESSKDVMKKKMSQNTIVTLKMPQGSVRLQ